MMCTWIWGWRSDEIKRRGVWGCERERGQRLPYGVRDGADLTREAEIRWRAFMSQTFTLCHQFPFASHWADDSHAGCTVRPDLVEEFSFCLLLVCRLLWPRDGSPTCLLHYLLLPPAPLLFPLRLSLPLALPVSLFPDAFQTFGGVDYPCWQGIVWTGAD